MKSLVSFEFDSLFLQTNRARALYALEQIGYFLRFPFSIRMNKDEAEGCKFTFCYGPCESSRRGPTLYIPFEESWYKSDASPKFLIREGIPVPYFLTLPKDFIAKTADGNLALSFDLVGAVYWFLSRQEENGSEKFESPLLEKYGFLHKPVIDVWVKKIKKLILGICAGESPYPVWGDKEFAVCLTHDVDDIRPLRRPWGKDPFPKFEHWMNEETQYGFKSTFFFLPQEMSRLSSFDRPYLYSEKIDFRGYLVKCGEIIRTMDREGFEVGLHGSYFSYLEKDELESQKKQIEITIGKSVVSVRQHYLHFLAPKTWSAQNAAGFLYDSTLGFSRRVGFRSGSSYPFNAFDCSKNTALGILEIPLNIQDVGLLGGVVPARRFPFYLFGGIPPKGKYKLDRALSIFEACVSEVKNMGGVAVLLWHPDKIWHNKYPYWFAVYKELLSYLFKQNAFVSSLKEVGEKWVKMQEKIFIK